MRKYVAEFLGTAFLVIMGCGSAVALNTMVATNGDKVPLALSTLAIAFAFGLVLLALVYTIGKISGCHVNPAVSLAMWLTDKLETKDFIWYLVAQFVGGIAGAGVLALIFGSTASLGANGFAELSAINIGMLSAVVAEVVLTFIFILTILGVTQNDAHPEVAGIVIGLTLTLVHIIGIPITGTSVNPARSFGPALLTGGTALSQVWLFILAPLVGAVLAAIVYKLLIEETKKSKRK